MSPYGDLKDKKGNVIITGRERKLARNKSWRENVMEAGYGKWLYERRKLRFINADEFRKALEKIDEMDRKGYEKKDAHKLVSEMGYLARKALEESIKREEALGDWERPNN